MWRSENQEANWWKWIRFGTENMLRYANSVDLPAILLGLGDSIYSKMLLKLG